MTPQKSLGTPTFEPRLEFQIARLLHCFNNVPSLCRASILDKRLGYVVRTGPCRLEDFQSHQILKRLRKGIIKPQDMGKTDDGNHGLTPTMTSLGTLIIPTEAPPSITGMELVRSTCLENLLQSISKLKASCPVLEIWKVAMSSDKHGYDKAKQVSGVSLRGGLCCDISRPLPAYLSSKQMAVGQFEHRSSAEDLRP